MGCPCEGVTSFEPGAAPLRLLTREEVQSLGPTLLELMSEDQLQQAATRYAMSIAPRKQYGMCCLWRTWNRRG